MRGKLSEYILAVAEKLGKESGIAMKDPATMITNRKFRAYMCVKEFWTFLERRKRRNRQLEALGLPPNAAEAMQDVENASIRAKCFGVLYNANNFLNCNIAEDEVSEVLCLTLCIYTCNHKDAKTFITKTVQKAFPTAKDAGEEEDEAGNED
eukprot:763612-Hanusia_phi.AAC.10